jgi:gas vesicle protein
MSKTLFNFSWDESGLSKFLTQVEEHLSRHDEEISELRRLLREKPSYSDYDRLRDELRHENDNHFSELELTFSRSNTAIEDLQQLHRDLNKRTDALTTSLSEQGSEMTEKLLTFSDKIENQIQTVKSEITQNMPPDLSSQVTELHTRLRTTEAKLDNTVGALRVVNDNLRQTANAFASLNRTTAVLGDSLEKTLSTTAEKVRDDITFLFESISKLTSEPKEPGSFGRAPRLQPLDQELSQLHPKPDLHPSWRDSPHLPRLPHIGRIAESVAFQYEVMPPLQGHLNAIHDRLMETAEMYPRRVEVQNVIDELTRRAEELDGEIADLRRALSRLISRAELHEILKKLTEQNEINGATAFGRVKCVACGKAVVQVIGARTERDANRQLGPVTASIATGLRAGMGQVFGKPEGLDSVLVESPRSVRPFKASLNVRKRNRT